MAFRLSGKITKNATPMRMPPPKAERSESSLLFVNTLGTEPNPIVIKNILRHRMMTKIY